MTLSRIFGIAFVMGSLGIVSTAFAEPATSKSHNEQAKHLKFPMSPEKFKEKVEERRAKHQARMEKRLEHVSPEKRKMIHEKLKAHKEHVNQAIQEAAQDGQITKEEAKKIQRMTKKQSHHPGGERMKQHSHPKGV